VACTRLPSALIEKLFCFLPLCNQRGLSPLGKVSVYVSSSTGLRGEIATGFL
jgi:hypothetical protein